MRASFERMCCMAHLNANGHVCDEEHYEEHIRRVAVRPGDVLSLDLAAVGTFEEIHVDVIVDGVFRYRKSFQNTDSSQEMTLSHCVEQVWTRNINKGYGSSRMTVARIAESDRYGAVETHFGFISIVWRVIRNRNQEQQLPECLTFMDDHRGFCGLPLPEVTKRIKLSVDSCPTPDHVPPDPKVVVQHFPRKHLVKKMTFLYGREDMLPRGMVMRGTQNGKQAGLITPALKALNGVIDREARSQSALSIRFKQRNSAKSVQAGSGVEDANLQKSLPSRTGATKTADKAMVSTVSRKKLPLISVQPRREEVQQPSRAIEQIIGQGSTAADVQRQEEYRKGLRRQGQLLSELGQLHRKQVVRFSRSVTRDVDKSSDKADSELFETMSRSNGGRPDEEREHPENHRPTHVKMADQFLASLASEWMSEVRAWMGGAPSGVSLAIEDASHSTTRGGEDVVSEEVRDEEMKDVEGQGNDSREDDEMSEGEIIG